MNVKPNDSDRVVGARGTAKIRVILTSMHGALLETQIDGLEFGRAAASETRIE